MKKIIKRTITIFMVMLLCIIMAACTPRAGVCNTPDCDNTQVTISNVLQDYCFNCLQERDSQEE